jgi:hypothetical protein
MANEYSEFESVVRFVWADAELKEFFGPHFTAFAIIMYHPGSVSFDALTPLMPTAKSAWEYCAVAARAAIRRRAKNANRT